MCECVHVCVYTTCIPGTRRGQKKVADPLALKLEVSVHRLVGPGNQTGSSEKITSILNPWTISLAP